MSGRGFRGPESGDGGRDGFYRGYVDDPTTPGSPGAGSSALSNLPVWALVLIVVVSGLVTLIFLWLCVLFICRKRRARRAAARDLEAQTAWESSTERTLPPTSEQGVASTKDWDARRRDQAADHGELTFVVMAGEDQPSYLARPAANVDTDGGAAASLKTALESSPDRDQPEDKPVAASSPPPTSVAIATEQPAVAVQNPAGRPLKTPPSPS